MFKIWQWVDKNTHIAEDVMGKKGSTGLERVSWDAELRVLPLQAAVDGARTHYTQYPVSQLRSSWGAASGVPITERSASGCLESI